ADIFLTPSILPLWADKIAALKGDAVDMEGAAAALPAYLGRVPYLLIRSISDQVRSGPVKGFRGIVRQGSARCLELVRWILRRP
ncbi:MAG: hypothetical protein JW760_11830, partial [Spirochaetales bacterium]|nr:hypothetical protein [Spirochaetales bacterium]